MAAFVDQCHAVGLRQYDRDADHAVFRLHALVGGMLPDGVIILPEGFCLDGFLVVVAEDTGRDGQGIRIERI